MNGSSCSFTLKVMISSSPVKNVGSEKPKNASVVATWSITEYCRSAEMMPIGNASTRLTR